MSQSNIKGLAHIGIFVKDMDASIDFYKRLGFTLDGEENVGVKLAFLSAGTCLIELIEQKEVRSTGVVDHIAMEVDDIGAAVERAVENGINIDASKIEAVLILGGIKNVFFDGPDDEKLEFFEYVK
jgi:lactoylglutathione lyase